MKYLVCIKYDIQGCILKMCRNCICIVDSSCKKPLVICNSIFFHIFEPNKETKGPENHSWGRLFSI
jgi:hypothetical protein